METTVIHDKPAEKIQFQPGDLVYHKADPFTIFMVTENNQLFVMVESDLHTNLYKLGNVYPIVYDNKIQLFDGVLKVKA